MAARHKEWTCPYTTTTKPRLIAEPGLLLLPFGFLKRRRFPTLPHCIAVPSAQAGLTSLFGMGRERS